MTLKLAALLILFPVSVFVPGFVVVRRFSLADELRLSVSVAVSLAFLYGASFLLYVLDGGAVACAAIAIAIPAAGALCRRDLIAFLRSPAVSAILLHYAIFAISLLLHSFHSSSRNSVSTARRLSAFVRLSPCALFAPHAQSTASRRVPCRTSAAMPCSGVISRYAAHRWKPSASQ